MSCGLAQSMIHLPPEFWGHLWPLIPSSDVCCWGKLQYNNAERCKVGADVVSGLKRNNVLTFNQRKTKAALRI